RTKRDIFLSMGFKRRDHLVKLCCWELMLGPDFMSMPDISKAIRSRPRQAPPYELIEGIETALKTRMAAEKSHSTGKGAHGV
ncbi:MAG: hypothetical protein Q4G26_10095, partial [Paracoccus sp. (in: a-proteobacteria)]|nr:hypothetical protein [Paracoccus sp. (in: a-proteobacteria)]